MRLVGSQGDADVATPRVAHPVDCLGDAEMIEDFDGGCGAVVKCVVTIDGIAAPVTGVVDCLHSPLLAEGTHQRAPPAGVDPQAVPKQRWRSRADLPDVQPAQGTRGPGSSRKRAKSRRPCRRTAD